MARRFAWVLPILALGACSEQQVLTYQGRPAATALECEAAFQGAKQRLASTPVIYNSTGALVANVVAAGMVSGMNESHLNSCLARVANAAPGMAPAHVPAMAPVESPAQPTVTRAITTRQPAPTSHCTGGVFQGGTSYCIGN